MALEHLGFGPCYHMRTAITEYPHDCAMWLEAFRAKYDGIGTFGKEQWDQLLGNHRAVCDLPAVAFGRELMEAYPDAKVILTNRDVDSWHTSCAKTLLQARRYWLHEILQYLDWMTALVHPLRKKYWRCLFGDDFSKNGRAAMLAHYAEIRSIAAKTDREILEVSMGDGWEPLCHFLGTEVPDRPYPQENQGPGWILKMRQRACQRAMAAAYKFFWCGLSISIAGLAVWLAHSSFCVGIRPALQKALRPSLLFAWIQAGVRRRLAITDSTLLPRLVMAIHREPVEDLSSTGLTAHVDTISLPALENGDAVEASRLLDACCTSGFFYLDLSSVNPDLSKAVHDIYQLEEDLFHLPEAELMKFDIDLPKNGILGITGEKDFSRPPLVDEYLSALRTFTSAINTAIVVILTSLSRSMKLAPSSSFETMHNTHRPSPHLIRLLKSPNPEPRKRVLAMGLPAAKGDNRDRERR
ncbi:MAG: hypothetical protein Q9222_002475 [Ikaeria aurantiellina]